MDKQQAIIDEIPGLRRFARGLSGNRELADDLVQDCLERALAGLGTWQENTNMRAWLFTILRNLYFNQLRALSRRPNEISYDEHQELMSGTQPTQMDALMVRDLESALNQLPYKHREVVLLVGLEGMNYKDAAEVLGVPTGTVMSRLSRGREMLKNLMDNDNHNGRRSDKPPLRSVK